MFSDHIQQPVEPSYKVWLGVAAGLVIACQLVAMALVVDGQVERAQSRGVQYASERSALAQCSQSSLGSERQNCVQRVQAAARFLPAAGSQQALADITDTTGSFLPTALMSGR
jgi:hypothetical protein